MWPSGVSIGSSVDPAIGKRPLLTPDNSFDGNAHQSLGVLALTKPHVTSDVLLETFQGNEKSTAFKINI